MGEFEGKYTELKNHCFEMQHNFFRAVEEHEEGFFNSVTQLAQVNAPNSTPGPPPSMPRRTQQLPLCRERGLGRRNPNIQHIARSRNLTVARKTLNGAVCDVTSPPPSAFPERAQPLHATPRWRIMM